MASEIKREAAPAVVEEPYPSPAYAWYVVGALTIIYVFSFMHRQILNLLVGPIRRDLSISDTQISLLIGLSFALPYIFFGLLMGRLSDSRSRRMLVLFGCAVWSLLTAGLGLARSFLDMFLLRMGVGIGQSALSPAAYSMIADYFPPRRRATAISVYSMGIYIGSGLAFLMGGTVIGLAAGQEVWHLPLVGETRTWQVIFFVVGLPGVLLALLMLTAKEPVRRGVKRMAGGAATRLPMQEVWAYIRQNWATFLCHNIGFALLSFASNGSSAWIPTFFIRLHGWTAAEAGMIYGATVTIFGTAGIVSAGRFADYLAERGYRDSTMRVGVISAVGWFVTGLFVYVVPNATLAAVLMVPTVFFTSMPFGIAPAAIQQMMPNAMRGQASSLYLFLVNLIGIGSGPTAVALVTDYVFASDQAVNYSLLIVNAASRIVAALLLYIGMKQFLRSLDRLQTWLAEKA